MKQFKLFVWIAALALLRTVMSAYVNINGIVPDFLLAFTIAYAAYERSFKGVMIVAVICGVIMSALGMDNFLIVMLSFAYGAALTYTAREKTRRMSGAVRAALAAALFTAAGECAARLTAGLAFSPRFLLWYALPLVIINAALAAVMYALLTKCFKIKDITRKLIIS